MKNLYESIKTNLNEEEKYSYITSANNPEDIGAEYEYNSVSNTEVLSIVQELKTFFTQAEQDAKDIIAKATHDPGIYDNDVEMCRFCAEKCQEMLDKMDETWQ